MAQLQDEAISRDLQRPQRKFVADLNRLEVFSVSDFCFVGLCLSVFFNFFCGFNRFGFVLYALFGLQLTLGFSSWTCWRPPALRQFITGLGIFEPYPYPSSTPALPCGFFSSQISGIGHTCHAPFRSVRMSSIVECLQLTVSAAQRLDDWATGVIGIHMPIIRHIFSDIFPDFFGHGFDIYCTSFSYASAAVHCTWWFMYEIGTIGRATECPEMALFLWSPQCQFG